MEIHKPKPVHSWREFATEIGVVVIGIAIALGGEQVIRGLERRTEITEAREALRSEIASNAGIALLNIEEERCYAGLADRFVAWLNGGAPFHSTAKGGLNAQVSSTWGVVKVGAASHMPLKERLAYSQFYDRIDALGYLIERERDVTVRIYGLAANAATSTPADRQRGLEDAAQWRLLGQLRAGNSASIVREAKAIGVTPEPISAAAREGLATLCAEGGIAPAPSGT